MSFIGGLVWYDADSDGEQGVGETPTPSVVVTVVWPDGGRHATTTDANGHYRFDTILAGEYRLFVSPVHLPPNTAASPPEIALLFDGVESYDAADFGLQPAANELLDAAVALLQKRHPAIVARYCLADQPDMLAAIAEDALAACDGQPDNPDELGIALDVFVWRWAESQAAFHFDFSADGGNYKMATLSQQAARMRLRAEDAAYRAGLCGFTLPAAEFAAVGRGYAFEECCP